MASARGPPYAQPPAGHIPPILRAPAPHGRARPIPAGGQAITATVAWRFAHCRGVRVEVTNTARHPCELLAVYPDGRDHVLRPGRMVMYLADGLADLPLTLRSTRGTTVGLYVPHEPRMYKRAPG